MTVFKRIVTGLAAICIFTIVVVIQLEIILPVPVMYGLALLAAVLFAYSMSSVGKTHSRDEQAPQALAPPQTKPGLRLVVGVGLIASAVFMMFLGTKIIVAQWPQVGSLTESASLAVFVLGLVYIGFAVRDYFSLRKRKLD